MFGSYGIAKGMAWATAGDRPPKRNAGCRSGQCVRFTPNGRDSIDIMTDDADGLGRDKSGTCDKSRAVKDIGAPSQLTSFPQNKVGILPRKQLLIWAFLIAGNIPEPDLDGLLETAEGAWTFFS